MNPPISDRDLEQLSAYLDGALPPRARAQFYQRLKGEPQLASALKVLQQTRAMLRRAPQRRVPRSFTLTREMLGELTRPRAGGWNRFSLVSAVASLLLVVVLVGDFSVNGALPISLGAASAPMAGEAAEALRVQEQPTTTGEAYETFTLPAEEDAVGTDLRSVFARSARPIELGLVVMIALSALAAWLQGRRR